MSRIGKKPIIIPQGVEVNIQDTVVKVKGAKGELSLSLPKGIAVKKEDSILNVKPTRTTKNSSAFWGLAASLLTNCIIGVSEGFEKQLEIVGVGYKAAVKGDILDLALGFSHPINLDIPKELDVSVEKNIIIVKGSDKQQVGQFAAKVRSFRKPEPYKGKGIRYVGEKVRRKEGKKAATAA